MNHESFFRIFPVRSVVKGIDRQIPVDAGGDACHPTISRESGLRRVARQGHPSLVGMRAMSPHHTLLLFLMENPLFKTLAPLSEAFPPLLCFLGGPARHQPLSRHHALHGFAVRDDADLAKLDDDPSR